MCERTNAEVLQQWRIRHAYHLNLYGTFVYDLEGNKLNRLPPVSELYAALPPQS